MSINSWSKNLVMEHWPKRDSNSHKSSHGKVGIIAGSDLMPGAAALSAGAAVESGAGLTTVNTVRSVIPIVASHVPEATFYHRDDELNGFLEGKDAVAAGPGLGRLSDDIIEDLITNFTAVAATINNIGPGLEMVGPTANFGHFNIFSKWVLMFDMLAGRLELFPMLMLFVPQIWKEFFTRNTGFKEL